MAAGALGKTGLGSCVRPGAGTGGWAGPPRGGGCWAGAGAGRAGGRGAGAGCVDRVLGAAGSGTAGTGSGARSITPSDSATAAGAWISAAVAGGASCRRARNVPPAPAVTHTIARTPVAVLVISDPLYLKPRARAM